MSFRSVLLLLSFLLMLLGCESREPAPSAAPPAPPTGNKAPQPSASAPIFLQTPIEPIVVEHAGEALPYWRRHSDAAPTLVLISSDPFLQPIPEALAKDALKQVREASPETIANITSPQATDPLLRPTMALSAALRAGFFGKVIWLLPSRTGQDELSATTFRSLLFDYGAVSAEEVKSFELDGHCFRGTIRGVPWEVTPYHLFAGTPAPAVIHIDLGFFKDLYQGEIKTPVYPLTYQLLQGFRAQGQRAVAVTLSRNNVSGAVSLQVRFLADLLARLLGDPALLDQSLPENDFRRHQALHLADFFQKEKRLELYLAMEKSAPEDAAVKYDLFGIASEFSEGDKALEYLAQAVALDPVYALEYFQLAEMALEKSRPDAALQMLDQARAAFPENPFALIRQAEILKETDHREGAAALAEKIAVLPWSEVYYPDMAGRLRARLIDDDAPPPIQQEP